MDYDEGNKVRRETIMASSLRDERSERDDFQTERLLLEHGADPSDTNGLAMSMAFVYNNIPLFRPLLNTGMTLSDELKESIRNKSKKLCGVLDELDADAQPC